MKMQEAFDRSIEGIVSQGFEQSCFDFDCAYRGKHGRKCAIGWLIPDEEYSPSIEILSINLALDDDINIENSKRKSDILRLKRILNDVLKIEGPKEFYIELQHAHDSYLNKNNHNPYLLKMRDLAEYFNLEFKKKYQDMIDETEQVIYD